MVQRFLPYVLALSCLGLAAPAAPTQNATPGGARQRDAAGPGPGAQRGAAGQPGGQANGAGRRAPAGGGAAAAMTVGDLLLPTLDRNNDGALDQTEIDMAVYNLRALDRDHDGSITTLEMTSRPTPAAGGARPPAAAAGGGADPRAQKAAPKNPFQDRDGDGKVTAADLGAAVGKQFPYMDLDGDGELNAEEQAAALKAFEAKQGAGGAGAGDGDDKTAGDDAPRSHDAFQYNVF